jgi:hypothetical protein
LYPLGGLRRTAKGLSRRRRVFLGRRPEKPARLRHSPSPEGKRMTDPSVPDNDAAKDELDLDGCGATLEISDEVGDSRKAEGSDE